MVELVDTHCHLDDPQFPSVADVLARAAASGVVQVVTIGTTAGSSQAAARLAAQFPPLFAAVGIQPNHAAEAAPGDWDAVVALVNEPKVVALGETGLDRYWDFAPFPVQEDYFARHLDLARRRRFPVVIHCRQAEADVVRMLRDDFDRHGPVAGVMHSFTGDWSTAEQCLAMGLHLSFAGMVTYKNAEALRDVARQVPLDRLLVETDSPYLTPMPLRGKVKRNEPAHVIYVARVLAQVRETSLDELAAATTANARNLFKFGPPR